MERHTSSVDVRMTPTLKADFRRKARQCGFSMSEALKSMIRDFLTDKITLTEYPDLSFKLYRDPLRLKQPRRKDQRYHDVWGKAGTTKGAE